MIFLLAVSGLYTLLGHKLLAFPYGSDHLNHGDKHKMDQYLLYKEQLVLTMLDIKHKLFGGTGTLAST